MQSSIGQNFILFSAILAKGKLGTRRGTWSESNTGHGPCWPGFGAAYDLVDLVSIQQSIRLFITLEQGPCMSTLSMVLHKHCHNNLLASKPVSHNHHIS